MLESADPNEELLVITTPRSTYLFLAAGLIAASQSGNIIRLGDAPAVSIAAWRLVLATLLLAPFALRAGALVNLSKRERWLLVAAGVTLAAHFITWIAAVQNTLVANAALLLAITPILTAIGAYSLLGEKSGPKLIGAIGVSVAGVAVIAGADMRFSPDHLLGDGLALASAALFSGYALLGRRLRPHVANATYAAAVYGIAAVVCFAVLLAMGFPVAHYSTRNWLCFALMALIPTGIGHTAINHALRFIHPARLCVLILTEPCLAGVVAMWVWDEPITRAMLLGYALITASVLVLVWERPTSLSRAPGR